MKGKSWNFVRFTFVQIKIIAIICLSDSKTSSIETNLALQLRPIFVILPHSGT